MAKEKSDAGASFWHDLFQFSVYKRNQGRVVRQVTFSAIAVTLLLAAWQLWALLQGISRDSAWYFGGIEYVIPGIILLVGVWICYRLIMYPRFADFLITVEAELNKVSWPSRAELIRSSLVVIFMMFFLAIVLFGFDIAWQILFTWLGVVQSPSA